MDIRKRILCICRTVILIVRQNRIIKDIIICAIFIIFLRIFFILCHIICRFQLTGSFCIFIRLICIVVIIFVVFIICFIFFNLTFFIVCISFIILI